MEAVESRFLRYVAFDTQSDESSDTCPSTEKQRLLGAALAAEMKDMGIQDARMDEDGYVYGTIPGDPEKPVIGLIAHMDTSPDASGADIKARVVAYPGGDICLNEEKNIWLRESEYGSLDNHRGKHFDVLLDFRQAAHVITDRILIVCGAGADNDQKTVVLSGDDITYLCIPFFFDRCQAFR